METSQDLTVLMNFTACENISAFKKEKKVAIISVPFFKQNAMNVHHISMMMIFTPLSPQKMWPVDNLTPHYFSD